jgi:hypothetical protein
MPVVSGATLQPEQIRRVIMRVTDAVHFFVREPLFLERRHTVETVAWELFRGRALDHTQTRQRETFESWNLCEPSDPEPILSIKWHQPTETIYVTRSVRCHVHEVCEEYGVLRTRPATRRVRELVTKISLAELPTLGELEEELKTWLTLAIVGCHRLPITSIETPLPEYSYGLIAYSRAGISGDRAETCPTRWIERLLGAAPDPIESARILEFALRCTPLSEIDGLVTAVTKAWDIGQVMRTLFCQVSLSPYTDFVAKVLRFTDAAVNSGWLSSDARLDLWCWLLRLLARHLSSFDLVEFHHRGANYPDALLIEELFHRVHDHLVDNCGDFLPRTDDDVSALHRKRLRRRAIRQTWLIGLENRHRSVPSQPTTPGESCRVLPPFPWVETQEETPEGCGSQRTLFARGSLWDDPSPHLRAVLDQSIQDLVNPSESRELGVGLFLDRPLGFAKAPGEPDLTLMVAHECHSVSLARQRLQALESLTAPPIDEPVAEGIMWRCVALRRRPAVVSLQDLQVSRHDFRPSRTTRNTLDEFFSQYQPNDAKFDLMWQNLSKRVHLLVPSSERPDEIQGLDQSASLCLRLRLEAKGGYLTRKGKEFLRDGLTLIEAWDESGQPMVHAKGSTLTPKLA